MEDTVISGCDKWSPVHQRPAIITDYCSFNLSSPLRDERAPMRLCHCAIHDPWCSQGLRFGDSRIRFLFC